MGAEYVGYVVGVFLSYLAIAADSTAAPGNPGAGMAPLFVAFGLAFITRRNAIGGWLFNYYLAIFVSLFLLSLSSLLAAKNLNPIVWNASWSNYAWNFLSMVPVMLLQWFVVFASIKLLFRRSQANLALLRKALISVLIAAGIGLAIDKGVFVQSQNIFLDIYSLVVSAIWLAYFYASKRVRFVFVENPKCKRVRYERKDGKWVFTDVTPDKTAAVAT
jgi:hypothetical protein